MSDEDRQKRYRKRLLALVAGHIASGIEANPGNCGVSPQHTADRAFVIAAAIVGRIDPCLSD